MQREKSNDVDTFVDVLVQEVRNGQETIEGLEEMQDVTARGATAAGRDPEGSPYYTAVTTAISILQQS